MTIEKAAYKGWANCRRVSNGEIELLVTGDVGPRILHLGFTGGQNFMKNFAHEMGTAGEPHFVNRGGSRIWIGPEDRIATYAADNLPVEIEVRGAELIATAPVEEASRLQKQMVIRMAAEGARVEVLHRVRNCHIVPVEFAIWALAVLEAGGVGITGFPPRGTHPEQLAPSNPLIMWAFTDLTDRRWRFNRKYLVLRQDPARPSPQKLGHFNVDTWGAYLLNGELFVKRSTGIAGLPYPDMGCSFEMFANGEVLELETLGPVRRVTPGEWIEHAEYWSLHRGVAGGEFSDDEIDTGIAPLVGQIVTGMEIFAAKRTASPATLGRL